MGEISHWQLQEGEEEGAREAGTAPQEALTAAKAQDNAEDPPPRGEESTPPLVPAHPSNAPGESLGGSGELPG